MALVTRAMLVMLIGWCLWLSLADIFQYPDRVSVLPNLQADAAAYDAIARDLARTWSLDALPPKHPPGWVTLLAAMYVVSGPSYVAGKLISWTALVVSVVLCGWLANRLYGLPRRTAAVARRGSSPINAAKAAPWVAAILCATSPALRAYVGTLQYEVITGTLLLAATALAIHAVDAGTKEALFRRAALAGLVAAVLVLTRETFAVVVPLIAIWTAQRARTTVGRRSAVATAVLIIGVAATPAAAWSAVQSIREGRLITISEKGPMVVELGNNPRANGTYNAPLVGIGQPTGLAFVRQFPQRALVLAGRKVLYFWGVLRDGWNVPRPAAVWIWRATTGLLPLHAIEPVVRGGWLLVVFLLSIWALGRNGLRRWWLFPGVVLVVLAVHVITLASYRFSVPVLPVVYVLVSGPLAALAARLAGRLRSPTVAAASAVLIAIIIAMQFQQWPLQAEYRAVDLDGGQADNAIDPVSGRPARIADRARGTRPVVLLADQYLPAGALTLTVRMRRMHDAMMTDAPAARAELLHLDGKPACQADVPGRQLPADAFGEITLRCRLVADGPATLLLYSLGTVDLSFDTVNLNWTNCEP